MSQYHLVSQEHILPGETEKLISRPAPGWLHSVHRRSPFVCMACRMCAHAQLYTVFPDSEATVVTSVEWLALTTTWPFRSEPRRSFLLVLSLIPGEEALCLPIETLFPF